MDIVFAKTRTHYDFRGEACCVRNAHSGSYSDFWDLVEAAGFSTCFVDEIRLDTGKVYITAPVNGETRPHLHNERRRVSHPTSRVIWWNLERPVSLGEDLHGGVSEITRYVDEVWVSDRYMYGLHKNHPKVRHVVMGSEAGLSSGVRWNYKTKKVYDGIHLGAPSYHRYEVLAALNHGKVTMAPNAWRKTREELILQTSVMVNIHQDNLHIGEPLRFALAAAYGIPLISDVLADPYPLRHGDHVFCSEWQKLPEVVKSLQKNPERLRDLGNNLHEFMCKKYRFKDQVEKGVNP